MTNQNKETKQELIVIDQQNPLVLLSFQKEEGLDSMIEEIRERVKQEPFDISTKKGQTAMRSFARFGIGGSKTMLVNMSDKLRADGKARDNVIRLETDRMKEEVDKIRDAFLAPLVEFENIEKERTGKHEARLQRIREASVFEFEPDIEQMEIRLEMLEKYEPLDFEEFTVRKNGELAHSQKVLNDKITLLKEQKAKDEELEQLRKEKEEREKQEREDKLKKEAADKATKEAEEKADADKKAAQEKADAEKKKIQDEKDEADRKAVQAEEDKKAAEKRADEAAAAERKKIADEQEQERIASENREADKKHRATINNAALDEITLLGVNNATAKIIVEAIAKGEIPHVSICY